MAINPINNYAITNPPSVYDEEAMTALELAGRTAAKTNECVEAFNDLETDTNNHLAAQDADIASKQAAQDAAIQDKFEIQDMSINAAINLIPARVSAAVQQNIDGGEFDEQIDEYAGELTQRITNLESNYTPGGTTADTELYDIRVQADGGTGSTAGDAVRVQIRNANDNTDSKTVTPVNKITEFLPGYCDLVDDVLTIRTNVSQAFHSAPVFLKKGEVIYATNYPAYGANRYVYLTDATGATMTARYYTEQTADATYNQYTIPTTGYYMFNTINYGVAVNSLSDITAPYGVTPPSWLKVTDRVKTEIPVLERPNLVTDLIAGFFTVDGTITSLANYYHSQPIYLHAGDTVYSTTGQGYGSNVRASRVTEGNVWINTLLPQSIINATTAEFFIPESGYYSFNLYQDATLNYTVVTRDIADIAHTDKKCYLPTDCDITDRTSPLQVNPLWGKSLFIDGDSIAAGDGNNFIGYGEIIAARNNMNVENIASGGATITRGTYTESGDPRHWICTDLFDRIIDADYLIFEGGVNDAQLAVRVGAAITNYDGGDYSTFCGALDAMWNWCLTYNRDKKIGFIIPHRMTPGMEPDGAYYNAIINSCNKWGIPYLDLTQFVPAFGKFDATSSAGMRQMRTLYTNNGDGWHPNDAGYKKYYCDAIEAWLKTL